MSLVIDTSALVAILFKEKEGPWCASQLEAQADSLLMSTVNFAELLIIVQDRQPHLSEKLKKLLLTFDIEYVPPSESHAHIVAEARLKYRSLNFGDCFAYALAKGEKASVLTLDGDFKGADISVIMPEINL